MQRTKAPFRADEVGSLLRPPRIKEARAKLEKGEITADDLRKARTWRSKRSCTSRPRSA
jgi:5-methyltetrahydropteroyltriglutamate--homocysteine methyltransferase